MKVARYARKDFVEQPWKNGGGVTTQLAIHEEGARWLWRVSVASVARSGPFSDFSGYERTLMLVEGDGMALAIGGAALVMLRTPGESLTFDGGAATFCTLLGGPVKDLNLMVDRERARGTLEVLDGPRLAMPLDARWVLAYALAGSTRATTPASESTLAAGELLRVDEGAGAILELQALEPTARVALMRIERT